MYSRKIDKLLGSGKPEVIDLVKGLEIANNTDEDIIVAVLLIGAIIWAIWYENFAGRKSETKSETKETDT